MPISIPVHVTAYECKTKQAEIFRRAASGETIIVTKNGVPHVEIRQAQTSESHAADAFRALVALQKAQLAARVGGSSAELRRMQEQGRD